MNYNFNWNKTKKNVEKIINEYTYYCLSVDNQYSNKISDDFMLNELKNEKIDNSYIPISDDEKTKRINFVNYFRMSFNKLTTDEKKMIYWTYLDKEHNYDDRFIANNLGFSLGYYYIQKKETIIRFAYALGVEDISN